ncbi:hypothetical protein SUNI508_04501 [Seiridium unicorne]|uniref:Cytochrome b5 heme-binding domain-containing protein n=1 Tax=Seiridium unicorne TaxID=138068 RepID=A0ABR2V8K3_9PEZI
MASTSEPLSPWATRFGVTEFRNWKDGKKHSNIAPVEPRLDPKYYADNTNVSIYGTDPASHKVKRPTNDELDQLFCTEQLQQRELIGLKSRQLGILNKRIYPMGSITGGHSRHDDNEKHVDAFMRGALPVREERWLDCFQKWRWFGINDLGANDPKFTNWNVDNPAVWGNLRLSLELADRIMKLMLIERDPWLDALFFGKLHRAESSASGTAPRMTPYGEGEAPNMDKDDLGLKFPDYSAGQGSRPSQRDFVEKFDQLSKYVIFSFTDEYDLQRTPLAQDAGSTTDWEGRVWDDQRSHQLVQINVVGLRGLQNGNMTLSERCVDWFHNAVMILHEVMHAVWRQRALVEGAVFRRDIQINEPWFEGEYQREIGFSFTNRIFGGHLKDIQVALRNTGQWYDGAPIGATVQDWPNPELATDYQAQNGAATIEPDANYWVDGQHLYKFYTPVFWISALLSRAFWQIAVKTYGSKALSCPKLLYTSTTVLASDGLLGTLMRHFSLRAIEVEIEVPTIIGDLEKIRDEFIDEERRWEADRPWYPGELSTWQKSPWGWTFARIQIDTYRYHYSRGNAEEAQLCAEDLFLAATTLINEDPDRFGVFWIFRALGLIMLGSLPLFFRDEEAIQNVGNRKLLPNQDGIRKYPRWANLDLSFEWWKPGRDDFGPFNPDGVVVNHPYEYLTMADYYIYKANRPLPVETSWYKAVILTLTPLLRERRNESIDSWGNYRFQVPPYKPPPEWSYMNASEVLLDFTGNLDTSGFMPSPETRASVKFAQFKRAGRRRSRSAQPSESTPYFAVAEAADNQWIVQPDKAQGWNVYDIGKLLRRPELRRTQFSSLTVCGNHGYQLREGPEFSGEITFIRAMLETMNPRGKLLQHIQRAEIAEYDGVWGMPLWITYGGYIFDITSRNNVAVNLFDLTNLFVAFAYKTSKERALLQKNPGGELVFDRNEDTNAKVDLMRRLMPHRCGLLKPGKRPTHEYSDLYTFTPTSLRSFNSPNSGLYTAIHGFVYDLTEYRDFHPGGLNLLQSVSGRDSTSEFNKYHDVGILHKDSYAHLRVGRMIEEREPGEVKADEIALHRHIFNVAGLFSEDPLLHNLLAPLFGTDATAILVSRKTEHQQIGDRLASVYNTCQRLVVAEFKLDSSVLNASSTIPGLGLPLAGNQQAVTPLRRTRRYHDGRRRRTRRIS